LAKPVGADEVGRRRDVAERIIGLSAQGKQPEAFIPFWTEGQKVRNDGKEGWDVETSFAQRQGATFSQGFFPTVMGG
jgi:hypothetical protein